MNVSKLEINTKAGKQSCCLDKVFPSEKEIRLKQKIKWGNVYRRIHKESLLTFIIEQGLNSPIILN